jgi:hypothetical protein
MDENEIVLEKTDDPSDHSAVWTNFRQSTLLGFLR